MNRKLMTVVAAGLLAGCASDKCGCCKDPVIGNWGAKLPYDDMNAASLIFSRDEENQPKAFVLYRWGSPEWCSDVKVEGNSFSFRHPYGQLYRGTVDGDKMSGVYMDSIYPLAIDVKEHPEFASDADNAPWSPSMSEFKPELTIIFLGANDFSGGKQPSYARFARHYIKLMKMVKENYGEDHKILCVAYQRDIYIYQYIVDSVRESGLANVYCMAEGQGVMGTDSKDLGSSSHPNYSGHMKYAYTLIPYIATITGWDMKSLD